MLTRPAGTHELKRAGKKGAKTMSRKLNSEIIDVDGYVHVVCGKVICFKKDIYDLSIPSEREALLRFAQRLGVDPMFPAVFGENTVFELYPPHRPGSRCTLYFSKIDSMEPRAQSAIRRVLNVDG